MTRYRITLIFLRKPFSYWYPGTDIVNEIVNAFGKHVDNGDVIVISEKAISTATGNIYDENSILLDPLSTLLTKLCNTMWAKLFSYIFRSPQTIYLLNNMPINAIAAHKKLALKIGGLKHFFKPLSEAGIDASNLPYKYVSLPLKKANDIAIKISSDIYKEIGKRVCILIIDTDRCYKPRWLRGMVFSTRRSEIRGVIDFGAIGYFIGKRFRKLFKEYPTPVACSCTNVELPLILFISKKVEKYMGSGLGRNAMEMMRRLGKNSFDDITWADMNIVKHYPAILVKIMFCDANGACFKIDPCQLYKQASQ
ncbi:MAG: coenzyme F420-0:L-glutamate ligase [Ignisphaera sp.]